MSETRSLQRRARDNVRRILEEQEKLNNELESKRKTLDSWSKELNKREVLTERERHKLDEEMKKVMSCIYLHKGAYKFCIYKFMCIACFHENNQKVQLFPIPRLEVE